jgi:putative transposase
MSVRRPARTCVLPVPRGPDPRSLVGKQVRVNESTAAIMPDNAFIESLNGKFRAECLNTSWFLSLDEARQKCEAWRSDYNNVRPHSAIGNNVPAALHRAACNPGQLAAR